MPTGLRFVMPGGVPVETCPFCRADLHHHCHPLNHGCVWLQCKRDAGGCGVTIHPRLKLALSKGQPVPWPHVLPDDRATE